MERCLEGDAQRALVLDFQYVTGRERNLISVGLYIPDAPVVGAVRDSDGKHAHIVTRVPDLRHERTRESGKVGRIQSS